jgi:GT2 family glycosyltransferase
MTTVLSSDAQISSLIPLPGWRIAPSKAPSGLMDCSLVIATYQRPEDASKLAVHLAAMTAPPSEVVIVDGSPGHETEQAIRAVCGNRTLPFELVYVRSPKGLTRQRNVGVDISTKPFVFFLDDDATPGVAYFVEMRRAFEDDTVAAAGAPARNELDKAMPRRWQIRRALRLVPRTPPFIYNDAGTSAPTSLLKPFSGIRDVDLFPGYAFAVRRSVFDSMRFSGFFEGYSYGEDVEMALRIRRQARVVSCGSAPVEHHPSPGGRPPAYSKGRMEVRNKYFIWKRYSRNPNLLNRLRFHLDFGFLFVMDLAWFVTRPWKGHHLSHALGLLAGVVGCAAAPPQWDEPHPHKHFRLEEAN